MKSQKVGYEILSIKLYKSSREPCLLRNTYFGLNFKNIQRCFVISKDSMKYKFSPVNNEDL